MQGNGALHFILESIKGVLLSAAKCPFELASKGHPSDLLEKIQAIFLNMTTFLGRFPGAANALVLMGITQTLDVASSHFQGMASNPKFNLRWIASLAYHFSQAKENLLVRVRSLAPPSLEELPGFLQTQLSSISAHASGAFLQMQSGQVMAQSLQFLGRQQSQSRPFNAPNSKSDRQRDPATSAAFEMYAQTCPQGACRNFWCLGKCKLGTSCVRPHMANPALASSSRQA